MATTQQATTPPPQQVVQPKAPPARQQSQIGQFLSKRDRDDDDPEERKNLGKLLRSDDEMNRRDARLMRMRDRLRTLRRRLGERGINLLSGGETPIDMMSEDQLSLWLRTHEGMIDALRPALDRDARLKEMTKKDR